MIMRKILLLVFCLVACGDNYHLDDSVDASVSTDANFTDAKINDNPCYIESDPMAEPTTLPVWNTDATNRTTPSGGLQAAGYATNAVPTSGNINWIFNLIYQWINWFKSVITANGGVTAAANQNITVSGTGKFISATGAETHGDRTVQIPVEQGIVDNTLTQTATWRFFPGGAGSLSAFWIPGSTFSAANILTFGIGLKVGDRIKSIRGVVRDTTGSHTISMALYSRAQALGTSSTTNSAQVGSTQTSAGNGQYQALTLGSLTTTIVSDSQYYLTFTASDTTTTTHNICGLEVTYDHP